MPNKELNFKIAISNDEFRVICEKVLPKIPEMDFSMKDDKYFIKERKINLLNRTYAVKADISYSDNNVKIYAKCSGIGPIQQKHVDEIATIIKNNIERGISEKDEDIKDDKVRCPKCGSSQIQLQKRGWTFGTGLIGSGKNERVCMSCLYKF